MSTPLEYTRFYLSDLIRRDYRNGEMALSNGTVPHGVITQLKEYPQLFVRLIGVTLLAFTASRIKGKEFSKEEETRIIISSQTPVVAEYVNTNRAVIQNVLHLNPDELIRTMQDEKIRQRDGKDVFYRDFFLPAEKLKAVYCRQEHQDKVKQSLKKMNLTNTPIRTAPITQHPSLSTQNSALSILSYFRSAGTQSRSKKHHKINHERYCSRRRLRHPSLPYY